MHRTSNFLSHPACTELSKRGFMVLCMNPRFDNNEIKVRWEEMALDVGAGVRYLRAQPGINKVVLLAHSGGGPTMSFYQAVAENGVAFCQDPKKLSRCNSELAGLPPADGIVFFEAHPGNSVVILRSLNPSLLSEDNPPSSAVDPTLDPFNPDNGYNPDGASNYSEAFQARFFEAQSARMNRLIAYAQDLQQQIAEGRYPYPDNDIIVIPRGGNPGAGGAGSVFLNILDPKVRSLNSTVAPAKLVRNDGSTVEQIVSSVLPPDPTIAQTNLSFEVGTKLFDVKSFLSANAVRSTNSLDGIDHCSSNNSTVCAVRQISVPVVFMAGGASFFVRDNEVHFEEAKSADKGFVVIEGATHGFTPCTACEQFSGQYSNVVSNTFNFVQDWINRRFG
jgi:pimeloyl-ACP methyl ester carboxylesterase